MSELVNLELPRPRCALCNKPVDSFVRTYDSMTCRVKFYVACHGATEETYLNDKELEEMPTGALRFGEAFKQKLLEP